MYEQLTLFPESAIVSPESPARPTLRIVPIPAESTLPTQIEMLPFDDEDAA